MNIIHPKIKLRKALNQSQRDVKKGNFFIESVDKHIKRIKKEKEELGN